MKAALRYLVRMTYAPAMASAGMLGEPRAVALGLAYTLGFAFLYSLTSFALFLRGALPQGVLLPIPPERWYLYQSFYTMPVGLTAVVLLTALAHGLARWMGGTARWQDSWMLLSLASVLPWMYFTWIPETASALLGRAFPWGATLELLRQIVPAVWQIVLGVVVLGTAHRLPLWQSALCVLAGTVPFATLFTFLIR